MRHLLQYFFLTSLVIQRWCRRMSTGKRKRERLREVWKKMFNLLMAEFFNIMDGALSIFTSAIDGVHCAINIQSQLKEEPVVELRIGIHTGDVAIEENAIYGDGVNLASRIESLAVAVYFYF
jgi:hypothetical protein